MPKSNSNFFYGYLVVLISFAIQVIGWGIHNSYGIFFNPLINEFGWSRAVIAGAGSVSLLIHGIASVFMGGLNDRVGPRLIMTGCGLCMGSGYLLMATLGSAWELFLYYGVIIGMGVSATDVVLLSTVARWFTRRRGTMTGIIKVGTGLGMVLMPLFLKVLLTHFSWRACCMVLGLIIMAFYIAPAQFLVRDPSKKGQLPDHAHRTDNGERGPWESGLSFRDSLRSRQFWALCSMCVLTLFCVYTILMHIVPHVIDLGFSPSSAANVLATLGGVSIVGRLIMGGAADRIGSRRALIIIFVVLLGALVCLQYARTLWMLYVFAALQGFGHGGFFSITSPTAADLFGTRSHGLILGVVIFSGTIGGCIGPILGGYLFDVTHSYMGLFRMLTLACIMALALAATLTPMRRTGARDAGR